MKKIFAIALVGFITVAFSSNAVASDIDSTVIVLTDGDYDAQVDVFALTSNNTFAVVPVATDFVNNVAVSSVNYTNSGGFSEVSLVLKFSTHGLITNDSIDLNIPEPNLTSAITNEDNDFGIPEPLPDLTKHVNDYNSTFGSTEHEFYEQIATNVGKLTNWKYIL